MATPLLGLYAPSDGSDAGTWGSSWNASGSTYLDNLIANITSKTLSASNVTLTAAECRNQMLRLSGVLLSAIAIDNGANLWNGIRCVENVTTGSFAVTISNGVGSPLTIPQGRRCLVFLDSTNGVRIVAIAGSTAADPIPGNGTTSMLFKMATAPTGWTQVTSLNDYALRLVSGTGAGTGGSTDFSTVFAQTTTGSHTLTSNEIPSHRHDLLVRDNSSTAASGNYLAGETGQAGMRSATTSQYTMSLSVDLTGGGASHSHTVSLVVKYVDIINATRD